MRLSKRIFDIVAALLGILLLSPLLALISIAIWMSDGRPVLFRQHRIGRNGRCFEMLKFRTMRRVVASDAAMVTVHGDPRVTRVGRFLRLRRLDELPQLINVLRGEMSLVGPRPEVERYVRHYTSAQQAVLQYMPGIADPASILHRNDDLHLALVAEPERVYLAELLPRRVQLSLDYAERATLLRDLRVIGAALLCVLRPRGWK